MSKTKTKGKFGQKSPRRGKRLGLKVSGGKKVETGNIIIRQLGSKFHPGEGTMLGRDFTIFATRNGVVKFKKKEGKKVICVL